MKIKILTISPLQFQTLNSFFLSYLSPGGRKFALILSLPFDSILMLNNNINHLHFLFHCSFLVPFVQSKSTFCYNMALISWYNHPIKRAAGKKKKNTVQQNEAKQLTYSSYHINEIKGLENPPKTYQNPSFMWRVPQWTCCVLVLSNHTV